ncbi:MAG: hypothetical protein AB7E34_08860 [Acidaminococcaceae bacterium]|nr:hypothetical protein [Acholeplasmataceae bacterium]
MKKIFVFLLSFALLTPIFFGPAAEARASINKPAANQSTQSKIPIIKTMPTDDGWLGNIDNGLQLAQQQNKKIILFYALYLHGQYGMTQGYAATYYVEQPEFKNAVKDKYILVYYTQHTADQTLKSKYNIDENSQMDMLILDSSGNELAREQKAVSVQHLVDFVNSVQ